MYELHPLSPENFAHFEAITMKEGGWGCYCSFWHQKWGSYKDWEVQCKTDPAKNRETVLNKVRDGFHVGALVYEDGAPIGWISVAPLPEFYWTWKRVAAVEEDPAKIAGIVCITARPEYRGKGFQARALEALKPYARSRGWEWIEGYPFGRSMIEKHGAAVLWPGLEKSFERAGFAKVGDHWLGSAESERHIYRFKL